MDGYNKNGNNKDGYFRDGYNYSGYNKDGYDRNRNYSKYHVFKPKDNGNCLLITCKEVKYDNPILNDRDMLNVAIKHLGSLDQAIEIGNLLDPEIFELKDNDLLLAGIESLMIGKELANLSQITSYKN